jgi:hypothetical protein
MTLDAELGGEMNVNALAEMAKLVYRAIRTAAKRMHHGSKRNRVKPSVKNLG